MKIVKINQVIQRLVDLTIFKVLVVGRTLAALVAFNEGRVKILPFINIEGSCSGSTWRKLEQDPDINQFTELLQKKGLTTNQQNHFRNQIKRERGNFIPGEGVRCIFDQDLFTT